MEHYSLTKENCENFWLGKNGHLCLRWSVIRLCLKRRVAVCLANTFESGILFIEPVSLDVPDPRRCWWIILLAFNNARLYFCSCTLLHFSAKSSRFVQLLYINIRAAYVAPWRCPRYVCAYLAWYAGNLFYYYYFSFGGCCRWAQQWVWPRAALEIVG